MSRLHGTIEGVVSDAAGTPIGDAAVMLGEGPEHPDIAAITSGGGTFSFAGLEPGEYEVIVNPAGAPTTRVTARVDAGRVSRLQIRIG
jgi:hypothetical protein